MVLTSYKEKRHSLSVYDWRYAKKKNVYKFPLRCRHPVFCNDGGMVQNFRFNASESPKTVPRVFIQWRTKKAFILYIRYGHRSSLQRRRLLRPYPARGAASSTPPSRTWGRERGGRRTSWTGDVRAKLQCQLLGNLKPH